jgi:hypothetical protein
MKVLLFLVILQAIIQYASVSGAYENCLWEN